MNTVLMEEHEEVASGPFPSSMRVRVSDAVLVYCVSLKERVSLLRAEAHLCLFTATFSVAVRGRAQ